MSQTKLLTLIRSRYPIIWIKTAEEKRVLESIRSAATDTLKAKVSVWSITRGFQHDATIKGGADIREPMKALDFITKSEVRALFILADFHHYMDNAVVIRMLKEASQDLRNIKEVESKRSIILLGPVVKMPAELENEIAVIDWDLPTREEIKDMLGSFSVPAKCTNPADLSPVIDACLGLARQEIQLTLSRSYVETSTLDPKVILQLKREIIRKSGILEYCDVTADLASVGGLTTLKGWLQRRKRAFTAEARAFGLPAPKGILLTGVPGVGKSLTAKAISQAWGLPLLRLDVGKVFGDKLGQSEDNMRRAIKAAEAIQPCILWIDEIDKAFAGAANGGAHDSGTASRVFGSFLTWLQEHESAVFAVATANDVTGLPPELLRKGRFDEIFFVDLPSPREREEIIKIHLDKRNQDADPEALKELVEATSDFSGAEIEQVIIAGLYEAFDSTGVLTLDMLLTASRDCTPLAVTMSEKIGALREWAKARARLA